MKRFKTPFIEMEASPGMLVRREIPFRVGVIGNFSGEHSTVLNQLPIQNRPFQKISLADCECLCPIDGQKQIAANTQLAASWLGLQRLVTSASSGSNIEIYILDCLENEFCEIVLKGEEYDQCNLCQKVVYDQRSLEGGTPLDIIVIDFELTHAPRDMALLNRLGSIGKDASCLFVTSAGSQLLKCDDWSLLAELNIQEIFAANEYSGWNEFRKTYESDYVAMVVPRVAASENRWINGAFYFVDEIVRLFNHTNWFFTSSGLHKSSPPYELESHCVTDVRIIGRKELELQVCGLIAICSGYTSFEQWFHRACTMRKPRIYEVKDATENAKVNQASELASRVPFVLASSRFVRYLYELARAQADTPFLSRDDFSQYFEIWLQQYVAGNGDTDGVIQLLMEASFRASEIPGRPGQDQMVMLLWPVLPKQQLPRPLRVCSDLPVRKGFMC